MFYLILFPLLWANIHKVEVSEKAPTELRIIFEDYQIDLNDIEHQLFVDQLKLVDWSLGLLQENDLLFFVKSIIYKKIIATHPIPYKEAMPNDIETIRQFESLVSKNNLFSSISQWLFEAIKTDLERFRTKPIFTSALNQIEQNRALSPEERREFNKLNHILPWMRLLRFGDADQIETYSKAIVEPIVFDLSLHLYQYLKHSHFDLPAFDPEDKSWQWFTLKELEKAKESSEEDRILSLIERILEGKESLPQPVESVEWIPKDSEGESPSSIIRPSPHYRPPSTLPKPVDDWLEQL